MKAPKLIKPVLKSSLSINRFHLCYAVFWNEHKKNTVGAIDASCAFPVTAKIYQPLVASAFRCTRERFWATHVRAFSPLLRRQFARKYWQKPLPENSKCPLPVDARVQKRLFSSSLITSGTHGRRKHITWAKRLILTGRLGTPTWWPFHCFVAPKWPLNRHVKTIYIMDKRFQITFFYMHVVLTPFLRDNSPNNPQGHQGASCSTQ